MKSNIRLILIGCMIGIVWCGSAGTTEERAAIKTVEIRPGRAIHVNGEPFFPIMAWLQDPKNFAAVKSCGMNAVAGYWRGSGGTRDVREYLVRVEEAGLYGVLPYNRQLAGHASVLGYIHDDEPDLPRSVSDAVVEPAENLKMNRSTPLWKLVDGDASSWSVLDPLEGASLTLKLKEAVTVKSLAVWLTVSDGLAIAREIVFEADGRKVLTAKTAAKRGRQTFDLPETVTFRELKLRVVSVDPGENVWGSLGEIEGFDETGKNVLLSPPRTVPRMFPAEVVRRYQEIKAADTSRPVFMTLTGYFHPFFNKYDEKAMKMYPEYVKGTDIVGFDIYPIYGWNKPEWIHLVHEGTDMLVEAAGSRPVYAWIETSKGGQWTGELSRQKDVTPEHIRAEVWMAICRGATAIGYFTHIWKPSYSQFGVPERNREALASINSQITRLTPALLGATPEGAVSIQGEKAVKLDILAKHHGGKLYLFTVNYDEKLVEATATVKVSGLPAGTKVKVVDEDRTLTSQQGFFVDAFEPLAVHIYSIPLPASSGER